MGKLLLRHLKNVICGENEIMILLFEVKYYLWGNLPPPQSIVEVFDRLPLVSVLSFLSPSGFQSLAGASAVAGSFSAHGEC